MAWSDAAREAALEARRSKMKTEAEEDAKEIKETGKATKGNARIQTQNANNATKNAKYDKTPVAHAKAAEAHVKAAEHHDEAENKDAAEHHRKMADLHSNHAENLEANPDQTFEETEKAHEDADDDLVTMKMADRRVSEGTAGVGKTESGSPKNKEEAQVAKKVKQARDDEHFGDGDEEGSLSSKERAKAISLKAETLSRDATKKSNAVYATGRFDQDARAKKAYAAHDKAADHHYKAAEACRKAGDDKAADEHDEKAQSHEYASRSGEIKTAHKGAPDPEEAEQSERNRNRPGINPPTGSTLNLSRPGSSARAAKQARDDEHFGDDSSETKTANAATKAARGAGDHFQGHRKAEVAHAAAAKKFADAGNKTVAEHHEKMAQLHREKKDAHSETTRQQMNRMGTVVRSPDASFISKSSGDHDYGASKKKKRRFSP